LNRQAIDELAEKHQAASADARSATDTASALRQRVEAFDLVRTWKEYST
jgi:hypothetical protein